MQTGVTHRARGSRKRGPELNHQGVGAVSACHCMGIQAWPPGALDGRWSEWGSSTAGRSSNAHLVPSFSSPSSSSSSHRQASTAAAPQTEARQRLLTAKMAYTGPYEGATWNAQALFARRARRYHYKMQHLLDLIQKRNFIAVQETHGTAGSERLLRLPPELRYFGSPGTQSTAGVGLLVQQRFLQRFNPITADSWIQVERGRAAILR